MTMRFSLLAVLLAATSASPAAADTPSRQIGSLLTQYKSVTGTLVVPTPSPTTSTYFRGAYVSLGGAADGAALMAGVDYYVEDGAVAFEAWYEWYPGKSSRVFFLASSFLCAHTRGLTCVLLPSDYAYDFALAIHAGDTIILTVAATNTTSGSAVVENVTTGITAIHTWTPASSPGALSLTDAECLLDSSGSVPAPVTGFTFISCVKS